MKKSIIVMSLIIGFLCVFLFINTYQSSPGYTTQEYAQEFHKNKPNCLGISVLLNSKATWSDAPGKSVCIGFLKRK